MIRKKRRKVKQSEGDEVGVLYDLMVRYDYFLWCYLELLNCEVLVQFFRQLVLFEFFENCQFGFFKSFLCVIICQKGLQNLLKVIMFIVIFIIGKGYRVVVKEKMCSIEFRRVLYRKFLLFLGYIIVLDLRVIIRMEFC